MTSKIIVMYRYDRYNRYIYLHHSVAMNFVYHQLNNILLVQDSHQDSYINLYS